ncbi:GNAT family N-acetyltransferase [Microbacterium sp. C5A9]|uniref:GNAT family N-acetyltransferase n=1 Tax=Microbacterium sp. C5A9 TaxID=2736663 RepID=UPI001F52A855|nr:GNAT family N-acetyltransferase [Microbacterium sp. C5A9]MCI1018255.1 GNAT family N-acetyltransferase [Microbacterium sp. C5A9]
MDTPTLRRWSADDLDLLRSANTVDMTAHLNGAETEQQLIERNARYLRLWDEGEARMFAIEDEASSAVGGIGFWKTEWRDAPALEAGWFVVSEAQGRGIASRALLLLIDDARTHRDGRRMLTAFPSQSNAGSNALCRRSGFTLAGTLTETFRGAELTVNEWVLDLEASR